MENAKNHNSSFSYRLSFSCIFIPMKFNPFKNIGPGTLVAAAFIGPGTVTVCTLAGAQFGFSLLWALVLSIIATIVLQEASARLGLIYGKGLADAVRQELSSPIIRWSAMVLIVSAILIGNSAYEAGNISGGVLGLETVCGSLSFSMGSFTLNGWVLVLGTISFGVLFTGSYKVLERTLVVLVIVMSSAFLIAAVLTWPNMLEVVKGMFIPRQPDGSLFTVIALIGTTVVPYNLFLHASLVREKWNGEEGLRKSKKDTIVSILLGGLVSMSIIVCAAASRSGEVLNGADLAKGLEPVFGSAARYLLGIGLFAAGITSAITAPMAAAYVAKGCFNWDGDLKSARFRWVWGFVLITGVIVGTLGLKPIQIIQFAQVANGVLLPVIAVFLLWVVNRPSVMKSYTNSWWQNGLGIAIVLITLGLCVRTFLKIFWGVG